MGEGVCVGKSEDVDVAVAVGEGRGIGDAIGEGRGVGVGTTVGVGVAGATAGVGDSSKRWQAMTTTAKISPRKKKRRTVYSLREVHAYDVWDEGEVSSALPLSWSDGVHTPYKYRITRRPQSQPPKVSSP